VKFRHHDNNEPIHRPKRMNTMQRRKPEACDKVSVVAHVRLDEDNSDGVPDEDVLNVKTISKSFHDKIASRTVHTHAFIEVLRVLHSPLEASPNHTVVKLNGKYIEC